MNEEDLTEALHDVMVRSSPPPSMDPRRALDQARRVRRRRQVVWTGVAVVPLVAGVGVGPALVANYLDDQSANQPAASGTSTTRSVSTPTPQRTTSVAPTTRKTGDPWPEGQANRTASAGPRVDRAMTLMRDLRSSVPPGFGTPDLKYPDGRLMSSAQSQYASNDGEPERWNYHASIPVQKDDRIGQVTVESTTPNGKPAMGPCTSALRFWDKTGHCIIVNVGGRKVGVVSSTTQRDYYDQAAFYRHDDGTLVVLSQVKKSDHPGRAPLIGPVFTSRQLAELATSAKFKISS